MQTTPTAIYARISKDREGAGLGVDRQEAECRALLASLGGHSLTQVYVDNDMSAKARSKPRPAYEQLKADARAGKFGAIVVWHTDRLTRSNAELEDFIDAAPYPVHAVQSGPLDLATVGGRLTARLLGAVAQSEIELKSERQKSKNRQVALSGHMPSGAVPWGYAADRINLHPVNGPAFQDIHRRVLGGESLGSVIRSLNDAGIAAPRGGRWSYSTLAGVLVRPLNAGLVFYDGAVLTDVQSQWTPLVTVEDHHAMKALLADPSRRTTTGNKRRHLLAGIAKCGNCRRPLKSGAVGSRSGKTAPLYRCGNPLCTARVGVSRDQLDAYVVERLLAERGGAWVARAKGVENVGALLSDVEAKLAGVAAQLTQDGADVDALVARMAELKVERAELSKPRTTGWRLTDVAGDWQRAGGDVNAQRDILTSHLDELLIASRGKTSHRFDSERVTLSWRPDPYDADEDQADNARRWDELAS